MRTLVLTLMFVAPTAFAEEAEPVAPTCSALADAQAGVFDAQVALGRAKAMLFSEPFEHRIAIADADEREELVAQQRQARKDLPDLRKAVKSSKGELRDVKKGIRTLEVACEDNTANPPVG